MVKMFENTTWKNIPDMLEFNNLNHFSQKKFCTVEMIQQTILPMQSESAKYGMSFRKLSAEFHVFSGKA
jgi:hypothetical protein